MDIQQESKPLPHRTRARWKTLTLGSVTLFSTLIAIVWALSDTGEIDGRWSKLALIFFTWLTVVLAAWALLRAKE